MPPSAVTPHDGARATLAWLGHPASVLALVVLLLNDHVLKAAFPGTLTGKLSDAAGLLVAPPLVAVLGTLLVPRLPAPTAAVGAVILVGLGFTAVKAEPGAARAVSGVWSAVSGPSLVRADPTDLLVLPVLALAVWVWQRARRDPVRHRSARLLRLLVVLPLAVFGVAATSAVQYYQAVSADVEHGRLVAGWSAESGRADVAISWRISDDAGSSWRDAAPEYRSRMAEGPVNAPDRQACSAATPGLCYRLVDGRIRVERSDDGGRSWRLAWEVTDSQRYLLSRRYPGMPLDLLSSRSLAVLDVGGGHAVLVANGADGFALRHPDGRWERVGLVGATGRSNAPAPLGRSTPGERPDDVRRVVALLAWLVCLVPVVGALRAAGRAGGPTWVPATLGAVGACSIPLLAVIWLDLDGLLSFAATPLMLLVVLVVLVLSLVALAARDVPARWFAEMLPATGLTLALTALPAVGWLYGRPVYAATAALLALLAAAPGLLLAWRAGRLVSGPPTADPPWPQPPARVPAAPAPSDC